MAAPETGFAAWEERFEHWRGRVGLLLGPLLGLVTYLSLGGLPEAQRRLAAVLALVVVFWISEAIPLAVTALLGPSLCVLLGIGEAGDLYRHFGNPIIFVFLGGFFIARGMTVNGLDRRLAVQILKLPAVGQSPERVRMAIGAIAVLLSMWISNTATAAMLLPIVMGIAGALDQVFSASGEGDRRREIRYVSGLMLMTAYSCTIGGMATPVGSPPNLVGLGFIESFTGRTVTFFEWMVVGVPVCVCMYIVLVLLQRWLYPAPRTNMEGLPAVLADMEKEIPRWGKAQTVTILAFATAVVLWVAPGLAGLVWGRDEPVVALLRGRFQEGTVALIAASLLFLIPVNWKPLRGAMDWNQAKHVDWGTILLFGGGLSLGSMMHESGLSEVFARTVLGGQGTGQLWLITAVAVLLGTFITELASNTASASMLIPVVLAVSEAAQVPGLGPALAASMACNMAFMLPVSTPPNAILYGSGRVTILQMVRTGFSLDIIGFALLLLLARLLLPLFGLL